MQNNLIKHDTEIIQSILEKNLHGEKDNDISTVVSVLQYKGINPDQITLSQYLLGMQNGSMPRFDSITRIRRLIQKLNPSLYGKSEKVRKGYRKNKVKQELNEVTDEQTGQFIIQI